MVAMGDFLELSPILGLSKRHSFLALINRFTLSQVDSKKVLKWKQAPLKRRRLKVNANASAVL